MPTLSRPRKGSLQFYPRTRARKVLPSVNWRPVSGEGILGFITYKVGMTTAIVKDNTEHSMTKGAKMAMPVTILEAPNMKIFSVRFYKDSKVLRDVIVSNDKELKKKLKVPKTTMELDKEIPKEYDDVRIIVYSLPKTTNIKKTPDMIELAVAGDTKEAKLELIKPFVGKEITYEDFLKYDLLDVRGVTKGKGTQGPVKRFGIAYKSHKSEKGQKNPGSIGPWHPAHVTFRTPMAGQLGLFSRTHYNFKVIDSGKISEKDINPSSGFKKYGKIKTNYIIIKGSVQGPSKRQILITPAIRPTKLKKKRTFDLLELDLPRGSE